jgi:hypothetical protein
MKRLTIQLLIAGLAFAAGAVLVSHQQAGRHARELALQRAAWAAEKAELEAQLEGARANAARAAAEPLRVEPVRLPATAASPSPQELIKKLAALRVTPGPGQGRALRQALALLEQLRQTGPAALPALREFLASGQDVAYEAVGGKGGRDVRSLTEALAPVSLRFGLFDVVRQIGGADAEAILAESLAGSGRGLEVAYLAQLLEEIAPGRYSDAALTAARALLARTDLGKADRDYLYGVLGRLNDVAYAATAQAQLVQADGRVDRSALSYLQQALGEKSVALAAQLYKDTRITEADSREPLARVGLAYVGVSQEAAELWHTAVLDTTLKPDHRRELVEDLNTDGLSSKKNPTPQDLQVIAARYALTQAYLQQDYTQNDPVLRRAFLEADKDLRNMLQRAAAAPAPGQ